MTTILPFVYVELSPTLRVGAKCTILCGERALVTKGRHHLTLLPCVGTVSLVGDIHGCASPRTHHVQSPIATTRSPQPPTLCKQPAILTKQNSTAEATHPAPGPRPLGAELVLLCHHKQRAVLAKLTQPLSSSQLRRRARPTQNRAAQPHSASSEAPGARHLPHSAALSEVPQSQRLLT